jgi:hypothetical protein
LEPRTAVITAFHIRDGGHWSVIAAIGKSRIELCDSRAFGGFNIRDVSFGAVDGRNKVAFWLQDVIALKLQPRN